MPSWIKTVLFIDEDKLKKMADEAQLDSSFSNRSLRRNRSFNTSNHGRYIESLAKQAVYYSSEIQNFELNSTNICEENLELNNNNNNNNNEASNYKDSRIRRKLESCSHEKKIDQIINLINK